MRLGLLIAGCTTNKLRGVYIISLLYRANPSVSDKNDLLSAAYNAPINENSIQEVRVGYLGLCARTSFEEWICDARPSDLVQSLRNANQTDHFNLIWSGHQFQTEAVTPIFL